ncbi:MAG: phosphoenolpyruvate--protein phosphotransferase [Spirochaetales bacterium]|jgi:phosphotransferase system enzyme I (PtsI)|nr:phosphoenolpyruvate--protein phosphotransferase [Spirochaetales bacterium]
MIFQAPPVSPGIALGKAFVFIPFRPVITERFLTKEELPRNLEHYREVLDKAAGELSLIIKGLGESGENEKAAIFEAHLEILNDEELGKDILTLITGQNFAPDYAVETVYEKFIDMVSAADDQYLMERAADFRDVKNRILRLWLGVEHRNLSEIKEPSVVFAHELFPSNTAVMDRTKVLGLVTEVGGLTCHSAIIARSYGIPALLGISNVMDAIRDNDQVILDALEGRLIIGPAKGQIEEYEARRRAFLQEAAETEKFRGVKGVTRDGKTVEVCLNIGSTNDDELEGAAWTDGVGLFRSEFLFMAGQDLPSEERQFRAYKKAAEVFGSRQVILRTLDIGGDKTLPCLELPREDNPFLGVRALRLCFTRQDLFKTQLRAALRASVWGNLAIMLPMVGSLEDLRRAKAIIRECREELDEQGLEYNPDIKVGIMIEIPAIALIADLIVEEVDFASIGTNDLCQYLLAVDRQNPELNEYYQSFHPAMFRLIYVASQAFLKAGKPLSVCGEMGGDPRAAMVFLGLGIRKLSMSASSVAGIKRMVTRLDLKDAEGIANRVLSLATAAEVESYLQEEEKKRRNPEDQGVHS